MTCAALTVGRFGRKTPCTLTRLRSVSTERHCGRRGRRRIRSSPRVRRRCCTPITRTIIICSVYLLRGVRRATVFRHALRVNETGINRDEEHIVWTGDAFVFSGDARRLQCRVSWARGACVYIRRAYLCGGGGGGGCCGLIHSLHSRRVKRISFVPINTEYAPRYIALCYYYYANMNTAKHNHG